MTATSGPPGSEVSDPKAAGSDSRSLSASVRRGALWVVASNLLLRLANVLLIAVIAHILSPHDFGIFAVALTAYAIVSSLAELGVSSCLIRADLDIDSLAPTVATVSVLSSVNTRWRDGRFCQSHRGRARVGGRRRPDQGPGACRAAPGRIRGTNAQMVRDFKQDKIFLANVIAFVPSTVVLIILAESGSGAMGLAWSMVVRQFVVGCVLIVAAPRHYRPGLARSALSVVLKFGIPLAGANIVNFTLLNVDYVFVGHLLGATALGFYMLAFTVASWPYGLLGGVINNVSMPAFSRVKHDPALLKKALATALRSVCLIVMPMCAMMLALARPLILTLYGAKWAASADVLAILSIYGVASMVCLLFANMLTSFGRTKILFCPSADLDWHPGSRHGAGRTQGRHRRCGIRSYCGHCPYRPAELPASPEARDRRPPHSAGESRPASFPGFGSGGSRGPCCGLPAPQPAGPAHRRTRGRWGGLRHLRRAASHNRVRAWARR